MMFNFNKIKIKKIINLSKNKILLVFMLFYNQLFFHSYIFINIIKLSKMWYLSTTKLSKTDQEKIKESLSKWLVWVWIKKVIGNRNLSKWQQWLRLAIIVLSCFYTQVICLLKKLVKKFGKFDNWLKQINKWFRKNISITIGLL